MNAERYFVEVIGDYGGLGCQVYSCFGGFAIMGIRNSRFFHDSGFGGRDLVLVGREVVLGVF